MIDLRWFELPAMSLHRVHLTSHKDTMVTANANGTSDVVVSRPSRHIQIATDYEAQRRLQVLDECIDSSCDNASGVVVHRDAHLMSQLTYSLSSTKTTRRPTVFNVVDIDELSPWSSAVGSVTADYVQQQQQLSHSGKTNRPRLIVEVISAHSCFHMD